MTSALWMDDHVLKTFKPTVEIYQQMQHAYDYFNGALFNGKLPPVVLSLHRHPNTLGYYISEKYRSKSNTNLLEDLPESLDEIALNPDFMLTRSDKAGLSTLVHEQVHCWVEHYSVPSRRNHHCKRWASKMKDVGLYPSSTAMPGGKETGSKVSHYIIKGGRFEVAADALLETGFAFAWGSVATPPKSRKNGKRAKYVCMSCEAAVWGKEGLRIRCHDCDDWFHLV